MVKGILIAWAAAAAIGLVAVVVFMAVMMGSMMGSGHVGMMGGRGSDPSDETAVEDVTEVRIEDFAFAPANIVVDAGTTIRWTNEDGVAHTVTSDDGDELKSRLFGEGETFSHTFDEPGEYYYHCEPHPNMQGLVTVRASAATDTGRGPPAPPWPPYSR
jgi:plastocyanin